MKVGELYKLTTIFQSVEIRQEHESGSYVVEVPATKDEIDPAYLEETVRLVEADRGVLAIYI